MLSIFSIFRHFHPFNLTIDFLLNETVNRHLNFVCLLVCPSSGKKGDPASLRAFGNAIYLVVALFVSLFAHSRI